MIDTNSPTTINFTQGVPTPELLPVDLFARATNEALADFGPKELQYGPAAGFEPLRQWLAAEYGVPLEQVILCNGAINMFSYLLNLFIQPGDVALVENPTYFRAKMQFVQSNTKLIGVDLQPDGVDIDQLRDLVQQHRPRLMYIVADFNNPTGIVTSEEKRRAIAEIAIEHDMLIVDDSAYYPLRYYGEHVVRLMTLAPDHTLTLGSFSKLLAPGIRTGWLFAPPRFLKQIISYLTNILITPNLFTEGMVTKLVNSPDYRTHMQRIIETYRHRRDYALEMLDLHIADTGADWSKPDGGYFIGINMPPTRIPIWEASKAHNLNLINGDEGFVGRENTNFARLPFCSLVDADIQTGVERLRAAYQQNGV